ncbi:MAG: hypothetical protein HYU97_03755 [Deltaproteobacteria bacterium]|nr:hypothetical protein [Deltaproteobacteria bacterium]
MRVSNISNLPKGLREYLVAQDFQLSDNIQPSTANPQVGDRPDDGKVSFLIQGRQSSVYLVVGRNDRVGVFRDFSLLGFPLTYFPVHIGAVKDISRWAAKIDPPTGPDYWNTAIAGTENRASRNANRGITLATGVAPKGYLETSSLREYSELPIGHPAKDFLEGLLQKFGSEIDTTARNIRNLDERRANAAHINNRHFPMLWDMKSTKAHYEAGQIIAEQFSYILTQDKVQVIYPGAGGNIGALATAMALVDHGAKQVKFIMTEIEIPGKPTTVPTDALQTLPAWMDANPQLQGNLTYVRHPGLANGYRLQAQFYYKGARIELEYAINDSPGDLYFHPTDINNADVVLVHDPYSEAGNPEALLLKQILPELKPSHSPKAIVIANELDNNQTLEYAYLRPSVLALQGWKVPASFGHGGMYPFRNKRVDIDYWSMAEIGQAHSGSGLVVSSQNGYWQALKNKEQIQLWVDFCSMAGGIEAERTGDPGAPERDFMLRQTYWKRKNITKLEPEKIYAFLNEYLPQLTATESEVVALVLARLVLSNLLDDMGFTDDEKHALLNIPAPLKHAMFSALKKYRILKEPSHQWDPLTTNSSLDSQRQGLINKIDQMILRLQRIYY